MTTEQKLAEARAALHQLNIGKMKASVRYEGRTVQYTATNKDQLERYIAQLEAEIAGGGTAKRGGPYPVQFS